MKEVNVPDLDGIGFIREVGDAAEERVAEPR
jgi:hypothetical protein